MAGSARWSDGDLLAFDLETTGVDPFNDVPVSFALVEVRAGLVVSEQSSLVDPGREIPEAATAVHGISTERARAEGVGIDDALRLVSDALLGASRRGVPVAGMKLDFDLTIVDVQHRRTTGKGLEEAGFCGPVLDALVLDRHVDRFRRGKRTLSDLCAEYGVRIGHAHDAVADARATVEVLMSMCRRYPWLAGVAPTELHRGQVAWHREWAVSFAAWRQREGHSPLEGREALWPIAS